MPTLHRTIIRPVMTEKTLGRATRSAASTRSKSHPTPTRLAIRQAIERLFGVKVTGVWTANVRGKIAAGREDDRPPFELEEGDREAAGGRHDRGLRRLRGHSRWPFGSSSRSRKSSRFRSVSDFAEITRTTPEKSLLEPLKKSGGRDNHGHISMRRRGGGHKRQYRIIDFRRNKFGMPATVREIEYDPNRSARIALVEYADGEKRYILHPRGWPSATRSCRVRARMCAPATRCRCGEIPLGTDVHNVELKVGKGGQLARSAGARGRSRRQGRRVRDGAPALDGDAHGARRLSRDDRDGRATPSTSCCRGARRARRAGWGGGPRCAARS